MDGNLYEASHQWQTRPDDQRYGSLQAMYDACKGYALSAVNALVKVGQIKAIPDGGSMLLLSERTGKTATLTHHSFGQLARLAGGPAEYLRQLPVALAAQCVNTGLAKRDPTDSMNLLLHKNGSMVARAILTGHYDRVWNYEVLGAIMRNLSTDWRVPPARPARPGQPGTRKATADDILPNQAEFGLSIKVGDDIAPAGLYASDHDMFAFLVNQLDPVWDGSKFMHRGVFVQNSEVGDCALKIKLFTYDNVCGNHIVWGVGKITEISVRHVKSEAIERGDTLTRAFQKWSIASRNLPTSDEISSTIERAKVREIGATKDAVLDALFAFGKAKSLTALSRSNLDAAYQLTERTPRYGSPRSVWGMVNGLTEYSQTLGNFTDARTDLDVQAGRILEMVA